MGCDARVSFDDCPADWIYSLQIFYYATCIWSTASLVTCIAYFIVDFSRKGWGGQPQFLLSIIPLGSLAMCGYCFGMAFSRGKMDRFAAEFLFTFPLAVLAYSQFYLSSLLTFLHTIKVSELVDPKKMYRTVMRITVAVGIFPLFASIASAVMLHYRWEWSRWTFILGGGAVCLVLLAFTIEMVFNLIKLNANLSRIPKRVKSTLRTLSVLSILWIVLFIIRSICYDKVLSYGNSVGPWMLLQAIQIFLVGLTFALFAGTIAKEEFSAKGMKKLRAKVVVTMDRAANQAHEVEVVDKSAIGALSKSKKSSDSGEGLPEEPIECASGFCKPIIDVDVAVARELAQPIWKRPPKSFTDLFVFPHPVNEWEARIHAGFATTLASIILILGAARPDIEAWWLYIYLVFGFVARFLSGPRFDPQAWLVVLVISPMLKLKPVYVPGPPKRFAQFCGVVVSTASLILYTIHQREAAFWALSVLLILAIVQSVYGICVGCFFWHLLCLTGFIGESLTIKSTSEFRIKKKSATSSSHSKATSREEDSRA
eukprot:TRINITY_DN775_c0_g1_i1.p1 TRINITY_DN775_c0_g1~~TRINITY_DN775_c0_g1_i1.p1  ORF type:complete len:572 (+),score=136.04 TRINITY_DN775_c0_g1_i1:97-1716(+)